MSIEENKAAILRTFEEVFNQGNVALIDDLFTPDVVFNSTSRQEGPTRGIEEYREFVRGFLAAFCDVRFTVHDIVAEGDRVVVRATGEATHIAEYQGIPATGKRVSVPEMIMVRAVGGKCAEAWSMFDTMSLLQQLGVMPRGKPPRPLLRLIIGVQRMAGRMRKRRDAHQ